MLTSRPELANAGYVFDEALRIWRRPSAEVFAYSDGDEVEEALGAVLRGAQDLSILSPELSAQCTDWPRRYHLSGARANLLRPLAHRLAGDVLEIGAGCGAITRFLGECGANVLALEGSQRRASIAALRTRDLSNVTVLSERFADFKPDRQFDVITLIGVLEYAALFGETEDPVHEMLRAVCGMLKPEGILVLAIENQLGLKYLGGAPEDHLGIRMFGVQDLYHKPGVETFGRCDLQQRLTNAGFAQYELALPFPDYKLPASVLLPPALRMRTAFNADALAAQSATRDPQVNSTVLTFALERVWRTVGRNGLLGDLANSFLFVASPSANTQPVFPADVLACHYSVDRHPAFCKGAIFTQRGDVTEVHRASLSEIEAPADPSFSHRVMSEPLVPGGTLDEDFGRLLTTPGWAIRQVADIAHRYIEALFSIAGERVTRPPGLTPEFAFPGDMLDLVPQNIVMTAGGVPRPIDCEWTSHDALPVGYLVFRALMLMLRGVSTCALPADLRWLNFRTFFAETFAHLGFDLTQTLIEEYHDREAKFMTYAIGRKAEAINAASWINGHLPSELDLQARITGGLAARNEELSNNILQLRQQCNDIAALESQAREARHQAQLAEQSARLDERTARRDEQASRLAEQEARLAEQQARADEANARRELERVLHSNVWRATRPLRALATGLKRILS
jgi:SAM-dependent methyltransferase